MFVFSPVIQNIQGGLLIPIDWLPERKESSPFSLFVNTTRRVYFHSAGMSTIFRQVSNILPCPDPEMDMLFVNFSSF
jgi:hypothetical protein